MTDMNIHTLKVIAIASVAILAAAPSFSQRQGLPDNAPNISDAEHERRVQEARDRRVQFPGRYASGTASSSTFIRTA